MQATDIHSVLTRPMRMLGQVRYSRVVDQSMRPMANARIRNAATPDNDDRDDPAVCRGRM